MVGAKGGTPFDFHQAIPRAPCLPASLRHRKWELRSNEQTFPLSRREQPFQGPLDHIPPSQPLPPLGRNPRLAPARPGKLAADGPGCVGVVAQVHRPQHGLSETPGVMERPKGGFQTLHDISRPDDLGRRLFPETAGRDFRDLRMHGVQFPELPHGSPVRRQDLVAVDPVDQAAQDQAEVGACRQALRAGVGKPQPIQGLPQSARYRLIGRPGSR